MKSTFAASRFFNYSFILLAAHQWCQVVHGFAAEQSSSSFTLFDRFRATCPATVECIRQFDPALAEDDDDDVTNHVWVAVYRSSNNNMPSVLVKDEFLQAMRSATGAMNRENNLDDSSSSSSLWLSPALQQSQRPVAVARLRPSNDYQRAWVMDQMRCILQKEIMDEACDGGSEHNEAIAVGIDALLQHHLRTSEEVQWRFHGAIRTKATLFSGRLLEERGFEPVERLQKDMASHISSLDACLAKYAERSVSTIAKSPGSRQRALEIVSLLGRLDRAADVGTEQATRDGQDGQTDNDEEEEVDPWAGMKRFF